MSTRFVSLTIAVILAAVAAAGCEEGPLTCRDAMTADDCEAASPSEVGTCDWVEIRTFAQDGSCTVESSRHGCMEFVGTQAGCAGCGEEGKRLFRRTTDGVTEIFETSVCGPLPRGWHSCSDTSTNHACVCEGCGA